MSDSMGKAVFIIIFVSTMICLAEPTQFKSVSEAFKKIRLESSSLTYKIVTEKPLHVQLSPIIIKGDIAYIIEEEVKRSFVLTIILLFGHTSITEITISSVPEELDISTGKKQKKEQYGKKHTIKRVKYENILKKYFKINNCKDLIGDRKYGEEIAHDQLLQLTGKILFNDQGAPGLNNFFNELTK